MCSRKEGRSEGGDDSRHMIIQDEHASLAPPNHCHFRDLGRERPFTPVDSTSRLSRGDGCKEGIRKVIVEVD